MSNCSIFLQIFNESYLNQSLLLNGTEIPENLTIGICHPHLCSPVAYYVDYNLVLGLDSSYFTFDHNDLLSLYQVLQIFVRNYSSYSQVAIVSVVPVLPDYHVEITVQILFDYFPYNGLYNLSNATNLTSTTTNYTWFINYTKIISNYNYNPYNFPTFSGFFSQILSPSTLVMIGMLTVGAILLFLLFLGSSLMCCCMCCQTPQKIGATPNNSQTTIKITN